MDKAMTGQVVDLEEWRCRHRSAGAEPGRSAKASAVRRDAVEQMPALAPVLLARSALALWAGFWLAPFGLRVDAGEG